MIFKNDTNTNEFSRYGWRDLSVRYFPFARIPWRNGSQQDWKSIPNVPSSQWRSTSSTGHGSPPPGFSVDGIVFYFVKKVIYYYWHFVLKKPRPGNRMMRMPNGATYAPENCYDDPANCDMYAGDNNTYASYTNTNPPLPPPDFGTSPTQNTMLARRSVNGQQLRGNGTMNLPLPPYPDPPQPPLPPPRCGNDSANVSSSSNNDSTISAEISEAECDREHLVNRNYGGKLLIWNYFIDTVRGLDFHHKQNEYCFSVQKYDNVITGF